MTEAQPDSPKIPWYFTKKCLVIAILSVGPLALPLLWLNPRYSPRAKIIWTVLLIGASYLLMQVSEWAYKVLMTQLGFSESV